MDKGSSGCRGGGEEHNEKTNLRQRDWKKKPATANPLSSPSEIGTLDTSNERLLQRQMPMKTKKAPLFDKMCLNSSQ